jgi:very-short-patch-repair endonuclease
MKKATEQEIKLYNALKKRGIECVLHFNDGHKTVDIAINKSNIYIEVDGLYHYLRPKQVVTDLKRSKYSERDGISTIHIFNSIIDDHLDSIAESIAKVAKANIKK